jgi:hypothetical protein
VSNAARHGHAKLLKVELQHCLTAIGGWWSAMTAEALMSRMRRCSEEDSV